MTKKNEPVLNVNSDNEFRGYNLFKDVTNPLIRTWNRLNTIFNIKEDHGNAVAVGYSKQLSKNDRASIMIMANYVTVKGYENARREIFREEINA